MNKNNYKKWNLKNLIFENILYFIKKIIILGLLYKDVIYNRLKIFLCNDEIFFC